MTGLFSLPFLLYTAELLAVVAAQVLEPPYFDIAKRKHITATSTCGYGDNGQPIEEIYCRLADSPGRFNRGGHRCDYCTPLTLGKDHRIEYAVDGSEKFWQSPPLSRGFQYENVNVTIDLGQLYHVAYVVLKSAGSPLPGVWALERSSDGGVTYQPWYYFAPTPGDCSRYFSATPLIPIIRDNMAICTTEYSHVPPFEDGEIHISLVKNRPGSKNFTYSPDLKAFITASHVRFRFLKVLTTLEDLIPLSRKDPSVTRRYYYTVKDIAVGGMCICNGHAEQCVPAPGDPSNLQCACQHGTCGRNCDTCCPGMQQYQWRPSSIDDPFRCEPCNCHSHSDRCEFNADVNRMGLSKNAQGEMRGGGVCIDCQHNTQGVNCELCKVGFYHPSGVDITSVDACKPCDCDLNRSTGHCKDITGQCECYPKYTGRLCDRCNRGYFNYPECQPCPCNPDGSLDESCQPDSQGRCVCKPGYTGTLCETCATGLWGFPSCHACACDSIGAVHSQCDSVTGQCACRDRYGGLSCNTCSPGYYNFPACTACNCIKANTESSVCSTTNGACQCKPQFTGLQCDTCIAGYYNYPNCIPCNCKTPGSISSSCDSTTGVCSCLPQYTGFQCDTCAGGFYGFPECAACSCDPVGSASALCSPVDGSCRCKPDYGGPKCDRCITGYFGFPSCRRCSCNPAGVSLIGASEDVCSQEDEGQCVCKDNVVGIQCTECRLTFYNLDANNPLGCESCNCNQAGTLSGILTCDSSSGQCICKSYVQGRQCTECMDGYYALEHGNIFGCTACDCNVGGSLSPVCDKDTGACLCRPGVQGLKCDRLEPEHFHPDLLFFSSKEGYGILSVRLSARSPRSSPDPSEDNQVLSIPQQKDTVVSLEVPKDNLYHLAIVYKHNLNTTVDGTGVLTVPGSTGRRILLFHFRPAPQGPGQLQVAFAELNDGGSTLSLPKGTITVNINTYPGIILDHLTVVPQSFLLPAFILGRNLPPCIVDSTADCEQYSFIPASFASNTGGHVLKADLGYVVSRKGIQPVQLFNSSKVLRQTDFSIMAMMSSSQSQLDIELNSALMGKYVMVVQYFHDSDLDDITLSLYLRTTRESQRGTAWLYSCKYKFGCRSVALTDDGIPMVYQLNQIGRRAVTLVSDPRTSVGIDSVILIPLHMWSPEMVKPNPFCITRNHSCLQSWSPDTVGGSQLSLVSSGRKDQRPSGMLDPSVELSYLKGPVSTSLDMTVPYSGKYLVIVQYYQPNGLSFQAEASVRSGAQTTYGSINLAPCPSASGCQSPIRTPSGTLLSLDPPVVTVTISVPEGSEVWLESSKAFPSTSHLPSLLERKAGLGPVVDNLCSPNNVLAQVEVAQTCRALMFSRGVEFMAGAVPCDCDTRGSFDNQCRTHGGQCNCRRYVVGRTCDRCRQGHFGFPECRTCNCQLCDKDTGECQCPSGTEGATCDKCMPGHFGYDPLSGCSPCNCDLSGSTDIAVCNVKTGQCQCRTGYTGQNCDSCADGFYGYPDCRSCNCYSTGVISSICEKKTGECLCRVGASGDQCDTCSSTHFRGSLDCLSCWCSNRSTTCTSSSLRRSLLFTASGWTLTNVQNMTTILTVGSKISSGIAGRRLQAEQDVYWVAPGLFLGDLLSSYGGSLGFGLDCTEAAGVQLTTWKPVVVIKGRLGEVHSRTHRSQACHQVLVIPLTERHWTKSDGSTVSREYLLDVLSDTVALNILSSVHMETNTITLSDFSMTTASASAAGPVAIDVEHCECPFGYVGLSCQACDIGYTKQVDASCAVCKCNGFSDQCDPETSVCINCQERRTGPNCERCQEGYFGADCQPCPCPLPTAENNFASSCLLSESGAGQEFECKCREGYAGKRCERCADGYFGDPTIPGEICRPCQCNNNMDRSSSGSCDPLTGKCLKCTNMTKGDQCELCLDGYFGNATTEEGCRRCDCNNCGTSTQVCEGTSGVCSCKPNVVMPRCDACAPFTWNFQTCTGCEPCNCGLASLGQDCDVITGQCRCPEGVVGLRCDRCAAGFWGLSSQGCRICDCPQNNGSLSQYCDVYTGNCNCGPTGSLCDICAPGQILTENGCEDCDECASRLLLQLVQLEKLAPRNIGELSSSLLDLRADDEITERARKKVLDQSDMLNLLDKAIGHTNPGNIDGSTDFAPVSQFQGCAPDHGDESGWFGSLFDLDAAQSCPASLLTVVDRAESEFSRSLPAGEATSTALADLRTGIDALNKSMDSSRKSLDVLEGLLQDLLSQLDQTLAAQRNNTSALVDTLQQDINISHYTIMEHFVELARQLLHNTSDGSIPVVHQSLLPEDMAATLGNASAKANELKQVISSIGQLLNSTSEVVTTAQTTLDSVNMDQLKAELAELQSKRAYLEELVNVSFKNSARTRELLSILTGFLEGGHLSRISNALNRLEDRMISTKGVLDLLRSSRPSIDAHLDTLRQLLNTLGNQSLLFNLSSVGGDHDRWKLYVDLLNESLIVAQLAESISAVTGNEVADLKKRSSDLAQSSNNVIQKTEITQQQVDVDLVPIVGELPQELSSLQDTILDNDKKLSEFDEVFNTLLDKSKLIGERIGETYSTADSAAKKINATLKYIEYVTSTANATRQGIREDRATRRQLNSLISQLDLSGVKENVSQLQSDLGALEDNQTQLEDSQKTMQMYLDGMAYFINYARSTVEGFYPVTRFVQGGLVKRLPRSLRNNSMIFQFKVHIRTKYPNGFLLFIGNASSNTTTDPYIALDIKDWGGRLHVRYPGRDTVLFQGPTNVSIKWREFDISIFRNMIHWVTRTDGEPDLEQDLVLPQNYPPMQFKDDVELLAGAVEVSKNVPMSIVSTPMSGLIDGLEVLGEKISLWDSDAETSIRPNGHRLLSPSMQLSFGFSGDGHVIYRMDRARAAQEIGLNFTTLNSNCSILLLYTWSANGVLLDTYYHVYLENGYLAVHVKVGDTESKQYSQVKFNDGEEHTLLFELVSPTQRAIQVDIVRVVPDPIPWKATNRLMIGGYLPHSLRAYWNSEIQPFVGCISKTAEKSNALVSELNVDAECSFKYQAVEFATTDSFIQLSIPTQLPMQLMMSLKPTSLDGVLYHQEHEMGRITLEIKDSILAARLNLSDEVHLLTHPTPVVLHQWQTISLDLDDDRMSLNKEGARVNLNLGTPLPVSFKFENEVYLGSVPGQRFPNEPAQVDAVLGVVRDLVIQSKRIDLGTFQERAGISLYPLRVQEDEFSVYHPSGKLSDTPMEVKGSNLLPGTMINGDSSEVTPSSMSTPPSTTTPLATSRKTTSPTKKRQPCRRPPRDSTSLQFSSSLDSYAIYRFSTKGMDKMSSFVLNISTISTSGIIFYLNTTSKDYELSYLDNGYVIYSFNLGDSAVVMNSTSAINDGLTHTVKYSRERKTGTLEIDGMLVSTKTSLMSALDLNGIQFLVVGGSQIGVKGPSPLYKVTGFDGCLKLVQVNGADAPLPNETQGTRDCYARDLEPGIHVSGENGYVLYERILQFGPVVDISFKMRSTSNQGLILYAGHNDQWLAVDHTDGTLSAYLRISGAITSVNIVSNLPSMCGFKMKLFRLTISNGVLRISLDDLQESNTIIGSVSVDLVPFYMFGKPEGSVISIGNVIKSFQGCISDVRINNQPIGVKPVMGPSTEIGCPGNKVGGRRVPRRVSN